MKRTYLLSMLVAIGFEISAITMLVISIIKHASLSPLSLMLFACGLSIALYAAGARLLAFVLFVLTFLLCTI